MTLPTLEEIAKCQTPKGGFLKADLERWGVCWPPPKGWRKVLEERIKKEPENVTIHIFNR